MRGKDKEKIILDILKVPKTRRQICIEALQYGVPESTTYRHINQLIDSEEIREGKLERVRKIDEVNREELDCCLDKIIEENNKYVIFGRLQQLTKWSWNKRILHNPNVIQKIGIFLNKNEIINDEQNLNQLFESLNAMLFFEEDHKGLKWKKITKLLVDITIGFASDMLFTKPNGRIIEFLGKTNDSRAVETIFKFMLERNVEVNKNEFSHIVNALDKNRLSKENKKLIEEKLDAFLRTGNERLINLSLAIREKIT